MKVTKQQLKAMIDLTKMGNRDFLHGLNIQEGHMYVGNEWAIARFETTLGNGRILLEEVEEAYKRLKYPTSLIDLEELPVTSAVTSAVTPTLPQFFAGLNPAKKGTMTFDMQLMERISQALSPKKWIEMHNTDRYGVYKVLPVKADYVAEAIVLGIRTFD